MFGEIRSCDVGTLCFTRIFVVKRLILIGALVTILVNLTNPAYCGSSVGDLAYIVDPDTGTKMGHKHDEFKQNVPPYGQVAVFDQILRESKKIIEKHPLKVIPEEAEKIIEKSPGVHIITEAGVELSAPLVKNAIIESRKNAEGAGVDTLPDDILEKFTGYIEDSLLKRVRYRVGHVHELSLPALAFRFLHKDAIVLENVIVFRKHIDSNSPDDLWLWAHELGHVQQYNCWGISNFAKRYLRNFIVVEREADRIANMFIQFHQGHSTRVSPLFDCSTRPNSQVNEPSYSSGRGPSTLEPHMK